MFRKSQVLKAEGRREEAASVQKQSFDWYHEIGGENPKHHGHQWAETLEAPTLQRLNPVRLAPSASAPSRLQSRSHFSVTPQLYSEAISDYAERRASTTLYPGLHFDRLATFLHKPFDPPTKHSLAPNYTPSSSFATLYTLQEDGSISIQELEQPQDTKQHAEADSASILFLRGQPCPQWLAHAGAAYHIDPEFFLRHLDFLSTIGRRNYFGQPSLLSTSPHIIQLGYMSIGELPSQAKDMSQDELDSLRTASGAEMAKYVTALSKKITACTPTFESIVRGHHILDKTHFAIEQQISICLNRTARGWNVVIWIDTGKPLDPDQPAPWASAMQANHKNRRSTFLPWIQSYPFMALRWKSLSIKHARRTTEEVEQSASLIPLDYGKTSDKHLMSRDPFYATHEVFLLCAFSEEQFLNALESKIADDAGAELKSDKNVSPSNIMYFQSLLDSHADRLRRNIASIKAQEESPWYRLIESTPNPKSVAAVHLLRKDYEAQLERIKTLSERCKSRLNILMNRAAIIESNKAIDQAKEVNKLTRLAFIFTPLSFTSSFFGMNLGPFVTNPTYGLWLFFAVSAPLVAVLLISMTFSLAQVLAVARSQAKLKNAK
ncbi:MAG: hypothetical protein Q9165_003839 [Trypethelium subeluteriae]